MSNTDSQRRRQRPSLVPSLGKIALATTVAVGAYQLGVWAWQHYRKYDSIDNNHVATNQVDDVKNEDLTPQQRRRRHSMRRKRLAHCRADVNRTIYSMGTVLRRILEEATAISKDKHTLKQLRAKKIDKSLHDRDEEVKLWRRIQEATLTRVVGTAYSHTMLFVILTVQVHLLSGHVFRQVMSAKVSATKSRCETTPFRGAPEESVLNNMDGDNNNDTIDATNTTAKMHRDMLEQTYHQFVDKAMLQLLDVVRKSVSHVLDNNPDWDIANPTLALHMTKEKLQATMNDIRHQVEGCGRVTFLQRFFVPSIVHSSTMATTNRSNPHFNPTSLTAGALLDECWDILESPMVQNTMSDCLDHVFERMREQSWIALFAHQTEVPVTQVIVKLKDVLTGFYETTTVIHTEECSFYEVLSSLPSVLEVGDVSFC